MDGTIGGEGTGVALRAGRAWNAAALLASLAVLLCVPADVQAGAADPHRHFRASTGVSYISGDYGQSEDTDILYVPLTVRADFEPMLFRLTIPYLRIRGPGNVVGGTDGTVIVDATPTGRETQEGLGDIVASATYAYLPTGPAPVVELTGKVKFPTADEDEGLGTGEFDFTLQLDLFKTWQRFTPFGTLGYRFLGDGSGFDLDDVLFASVGTSIRVTSRLSAGLVYDWREASTGGVSDAHELVPFASFKFGERYRLNGYGIAGLSSGAADWGGGLAFGVDF